MNSGTDKQANIAEAERLMVAAIEAEAPDLLMLPETWDYLGGTPEGQIAAAEDIPGGPAYEMCRAVAARHGVFVHAGSLTEKVPGETRVHNTTVAFDRAGEEAARYRKIHMFDVETPGGRDYRESDAIKPGREIVTYEADGVTVGCSICYDLRFPELYQALVRQGAEVIALPAAFTKQTGMDHWEVLCRARAIETQTYVLASAQTGSHPHGNEERECYGHSLAVDPWGHVVAKASDGVGFVSTRIERSRVQDVRTKMPVAKQHVLDR
jgi:nitrilase